MFEDVVIIITYGERLEWDMTRSQVSKRRNGIHLVRGKFKDIGLQLHNYQWLTSDLDSDDNLVQTYKRRKVA